MLKLKLIEKGNGWFVQRIIGRNQDEYLYPVKDKALGEYWLQMHDTFYGRHFRLINDPDVKNEVLRCSDVSLLYENGENELPTPRVGFYWKGHKYYTNSENVALV